MSPALFLLVIFEIGSCTFAWASLDGDLPVEASCLAGMTGVCYHAQLLLIEMGSRELGAQAGLNL
jgi:hypothetical protein